MKKLTKKLLFISLLSIFVQADFLMTLTDKIVFV